jgi:hypothetical protein
MRGLSQPVVGRKLMGWQEKKFRTWLKKSQRGDAASTLGRSQVFTPFEN